jgi:hypothetical protein
MAIVYKGSGGVGEKATEAEMQQAECRRGRPAVVPNCHLPFAFPIAICHLPFASMAGSSAPHHLLYYPPKY